MNRLPRRLVLLLEIAIALAIAWFAWRALRAQWADVTRIAAGVRPDWLRIAGATVIVFATYLMLVEVWRRMVLAWGERLAFPDAARIWFVSSLARYIPGKLWQVGAMGIMAQRAGVSPVAASGSALLATLANLLAGAAVLLVVASGALRDRFGTPALVALAVLTPALLLLLVTLPRLARWTGALIGRDVQVPPLPPGGLWIAFFGSVVSWLLYGVAFQQLSTAVLGTTTGTMQDYIAVYTASYLVGFLVLFAPGGVGFREMTMIPLMQSLGLATAPQALVVAVTSRLWLTVVELGPGLLLLAASRRGAGATPNASDAT